VKKPAPNLSPRPKPKLNQITKKLTDLMKSCYVVPVLCPTSPSEAIYVTQRAELYQPSGHGGIGYDCRRPAAIPIIGMVNGRPSLRSELTHQTAVKPKRGSLRGIWSGVEIDESHIFAAKQSLLSYEYKDEEH